MARGDARTRVVVARYLKRSYAVVVPTPVIAQVHRGGRDRARVDRILKTADAYLPTSADTARKAGELLGQTGMSDAVDAIVAAEALGGAPATIVTSDPGDLVSLVEAGAGSERVRVVGV